jgi:NAD(P)-dependent dehydrogenase (short-subunit alcohol dehydrogenase family)
VAITGAASGMGRATRALFADEGAHVAALDISPIDPVVAEITEAGGSVRGWQLDVSRKDDIDRWSTRSPRTSAASTSW